MSRILTNLQPWNCWLAAVVRDYSVVSLTVQLFYSQTALLCDVLYNIASKTVQSWQIM